MAKKYVSLSKLSTFLDNLKNLFATKDTVESISTNVAYINTTDNETITDTETSSSSVTVDSYLSTTSTNPVQNKVITKEINELSQAIESNAKIDVTAEVGQTIVVEEVDANGKPTAWESADYQPRTHWTERVEVLPETTVEIDPETDEGYCAEAIGLAVGENYTVKWNGAEYNCTAQVYSVPDSEGIMVRLGVVLGNLDLLMGGEGTGEPFVILESFPDHAAEFLAPVVILAVDGSATVTLSIAGTVYHPIPSEYVPYALPYYINLIVVYDNEGNIESAACNETVSQLEDIYRSGRTLVLQYTKQEISDDGPRGTIATIYKYRLQLATAALSLRFPGIMFQFTSPHVIWHSNGSYMAPICNLTPNEDGAYTVTFEVG